MCASTLILQIVWSTNPSLPGMYMHAQVIAEVQLALLHCCMHVMMMIIIIILMCPLHSQVTVKVITADITPPINSSQLYVLPFFVRSTGRWKMRAVPTSSLGGALPPVNRTPFSRRMKSFLTVTSSEQLMVRMLPSTTVTGPTGSIVTVWATETPNTPNNK